MRPSERSSNSSTARPPEPQDPLDPAAEEGSDEPVEASSGPPAAELTGSEEAGPAGGEDLGIDPGPSPPTRPGEGEPGVTLVLGGGGFKGLAHVGVFRVLEEAGIPIERIIGTSAGALMGAAYAHAGSAADLFDLVVSFVGSDDLQKKGFVGFGARTRSGLFGRVVSGIKRQVALERMFRHSSAFGGAALRFVVRSLVPKAQIEDLQPRLAIAALDLDKGEEVLLTEGPLASAVCASASVPGFFPPVVRQGQVLVDAGIVNNLPTQAARGLGAVRVVAVDLSAGLDGDQLHDVGMDVLLRAQDISTRLANRRLSDQADVVLCPDIGGRSWLDASDPASLIEAGAAATRSRLDEIRVLVGTARRPGP